TTQNMSPSYQNLPLATMPSTDEYTCAKSILDIMKQQATNDYGYPPNTYYVAENLAAQLLPGLPHLTSLYEVYLENIKISVAILDARNEDDLEECVLTHHQLMIACPDYNNGTVSIPQFGNQPINVGGLYSVTGGGITWGNVFMVNVSQGRWAPEA